jgi:hypothetical protein
MLKCTFDNVAYIIYAFFYVSGTNIPEGCK